MASLKKKSFSKTPHLIYDKLDNNRKLEFFCTEKENKKNGKKTKGDNSYKIFFNGRYLIFKTHKVLVSK